MTDEKKKDNINIPDDIEELLDELLDMEEKAAEEAEGEPSEVMALPMIPLRGLHIFPNMVLHFDVGREKSVKALETAMVTNQKIFLTEPKSERYFRSRRTSNALLKTLKKSYRRKSHRRYWRSREVLRQPLTSTQSLLISSMGKPLVQSRK